jgi:hypothetical protein
MHCISTYGANLWRHDFESEDKDIGTFLEDIPTSRRLAVTKKHIECTLYPNISF